ncbi:MAG: DUF58 domain-containing protein [Nitrospinae bacterium]|nr:DUF58 domain-containing protein [Nitrospinota bacterium]
MLIPLKRFAYRFYRSSSSLQYRLLRRFTPGGLLAMSAMSASVLIGLDTNRNLAHQIFTLLFSLMAISVVAVRRFRGRFFVRRELPRYGTVGEKVSYKITVHNQTSKFQKGLFLREEPADPRPSFDEFFNAREPGEEKRNWVDRTLGAYRWSWLISQKQLADLKDQSLPSLLPNGAGEVRMEFTPGRRGVVRFSRISIGKTDPLGLFSSFISIPDEQSLLVLPKRYAIPRLQLPGARKYHQGGVALASEVGDSEEFIGLRDYRPGDPLRHIHWKSWARTGNPVVKEFQQEYFARHALILDTFTSPGNVELFEEAVAVAASFANGLETRDALLDLMFIGDEAHCFTAGRSLASPDGMLEILASVKICHDRPFSSLRDAVLNRAPLLSGCICILLAWDDERKDLVQRLEAYGVSPTVLVLSDAPLDPQAGQGQRGSASGNFHALEVGKVKEGLARLSIR